MGMQVGAGYIGTSGLTSSTPNLDIIQPLKPASYTTAVTFSVYKFDFINQSACTVLVNDSIVPIYLAANQGFETGYEDTPIYSFKIIEAGIVYNYVGAYA